MCNDKSGHRQSQFLVVDKVHHLQRIKTAHRDTAERNVIRRIPFQHSSVKQRYLLGRLRHHLHDGIVEHTIRSYIIREYLDGCYYDDSLTVIACNDRLKANGVPPLTKLTSEMEGRQ